MDDKTIIICVIGVSIALFLSAVAIANGGYTIRFEMDDNTLDYLLEHDYCIVHDQDSDFIFMGDCEYSISFTNRFYNITNLNLSDEFSIEKKYNQKLEDIQWDYERFPTDTRVVKRIEVK